MPFETTNLTSFPMEKVCYDLKLEVLEEMDAKDTIALAKVNAGFQLMLSRNPSLVFGRHVNEIVMNDERIRIFRGSYPIHVTYLPLSKRIYSCDKLEINFGKGEEGDQLNNEQATILTQLNYVKRLCVCLDKNECLLKFFENFHSTIEDCAWISIYLDSLKEKHVISELFENFIANQVKNCKEVVFLCDSGAVFHYYYDTFAKTSVKFWRMETVEDHFEEIVQTMVKKRIPSKDLKAAFFMIAELSSAGMDARITNFLSQFPGMKQFAGENNQEVMNMANELLEEYVAHDPLLHFDGLIFRRNIDSSRDCVYMLPLYDRFIQFFAFYVQPQ